MKQPTRLAEWLLSFPSSKWNVDLGELCGLQHRVTGEYENAPMGGVQAPMIAGQPRGHLTALHGDPRSVPAMPKRRCPTFPQEMARVRRLSRTH